MSEVKPPVQYGAAPVAAPTGNKEHYVQDTPSWVVAVRGVQIFFSLVILGMAGAVIHDVMIEELAYAIACVVFTWIVIGYVLITEKVSGAREAYNIWAVLSLDLLMAILWLASLGAVAARRARFVVPVNVGACYDDGSAVNSKTCQVYKRGIQKRAVLTQLGMGLTSGAAGLSALMWILFIVTLVYHGHTFRLWHQANKKPADAELNAQGAPMLATQQQPAPAPGPVYNDQQQYQPQTQFAQQYPPQQQPQQQYPPHQQQQQQPQQQQQYAAQPAQQFQQQQQVPFQPSPVGTPSPAPQFQTQYQTPQPTGTPQPYAYPQQQQQQQYPPAAEAPGHPYYPPQ
ncbi:hypothetical protein B0T21DRAFT_88408 [Apiosordaria backusii]|uniref:MARVEL domain-containing protein n=1 Tax=Apiosordaria backusii TaxID=314023 RepID=A0AA40ES17_9PEZI|nr:hypothetical protein B0T21DRAFT_88408 [Apiosordaria backusii]